MNTGPMNSRSRFFLPPQLLQRREVERGWTQRIEEMLFTGNSAEQLLAVVPLADFIIFRNYVSVTEGMQEPAQDIVRQAMADLQIIYLLYFPKFIHCLFACHGMRSPAMTDNWSLR